MMVALLTLAGCLDAPEGDVEWAYVEGSPEWDYDPLSETLTVRFDGVLTAAGATRPFILGGLFTTPCQLGWAPPDSSRIDSYELAFDTDPQGALSHALGFTLTGHVDREGNAASVVEVGEEGRFNRGTTCHGGKVFLPV